LAVAHDRQPRPAIRIEKAVFDPIATPEFVTRQAKPPNQFRGHITPCQSDSQAHVSFFATGLVLIVCP
jgi:hypothetical protein